MKKFIIILLSIFMLATSVSCSVAMKNFRTMATYKDPETTGGYWDITTETGQSFKHVRCTYWGTGDDTACFVTDDGTLIYQSGAITCIKLKD